MSQEITDLFFNDQADRTDKDWSDEFFLEELRKNDRERHRRAVLLIQDGSLQHANADDYYHLSFIFQHGESVDDYKLAHELARKAMELGHPGAPRMVANTTDRFLVHTALGSVQKYGTQSHWDKEKGEYVMYPVDPTTTDEERKQLGVPTLKELQKELRQYKKLRK